jgi:hypothetical protein
MYHVSNNVDNGNNNKAKSYNSHTNEKALPQEANNYLEKITYEQNAYLLYSIMSINNYYSPNKFVHFLETSVNALAICKVVNLLTPIFLLSNIVVCAKYLS